MRKALLLAPFALISVLLAAPPASAQESLCSDTATVSWQTDLATLQVTGAVIEVPGCDDADFVGLQLLLGDGSTVPEDGPLSGAASNGFASFDLRPFRVGIEPVVGVRVFLELDDEPTPVVLITVEQRFFNPAGQEQLGLRITTELLVPIGSSFNVPGPAPGYETVDCTTANLETQETPISTGVGAFIAERSGLHIACYQLVPGPPGGPPDAEEPEVIEDDDTEVLDDVIEDDGTEVLDEVLEADDTAGSDADADTAATDRDVQDPAAPAASVLGRTLVRTGAGSLQIGLFGAILVLGGGLLLRRRGRSVRS